MATRRWLGALAIAAVFAVAAFYLGRWQWHRYEAKHAAAVRVETHYHAPPRPVADVLGTAPVPLAREWTTVRATGTYAADHTLLVRNRPFEGTYGYEVLVPLRVDGGATLLVDRGWVPNAKTAEDRPDVPPAPSGEVTVTGWVKQGEVSLGRRMPAGQLASINLREAQAQTGGQLLGAYLVLDRETTASGATPARPQPLEPPDTDLGPHQAYAFQWWLAMVAGFVLVFFGVRREYLEGRDDVAGEGDAVAGRPAREPVPAGSAASHVAGTAPGRPRRAAKPKKIRIWDEEDG